MNIPYVMKRCSCCGEWLVASTINFHRAKKERYGLTSQCKECRNNKNKQYHEANRDKILERQRQYYEANREKELERCKQYRENNKEKVRERQKRYDKQRYENNKEKECERSKQWYEANREKALEQKKQYRQSPQGKVVRFNSCQRRRIREEEQGSGITTDQWLEMMKYFDFRCAYSGETLTKKTRSIDHIVPISTGGDNMIWNMVPMLRNLNSSKNTKDMLEWYKEQDFYDPKRLQKIYMWQEYAYNKYGKDSEYFNSGDIQIKLL